jgi:phage terminase large subunit-like protein
VASQADLHEATVVLIEDRSSGSSLIQQLRADGLSKVQAAPAMDGDKIMRLHGQALMIEGGFVLFPKQEHWLDTYLSELLSFPSSPYDDQVDSTAYALAWIGANSRWSDTVIKKPWLHYYATLPEDQGGKRIFMSWDTALMDSRQNTWTVCTVWMLLERVYYLLHMERGIYDYTDLRQTFGTLVKQYNPYQILIEETATGLALKEERDLPSRSLIKLQPVEQDRKGRVYVQQAKFRDGLVRFPQHASFMSQVERELLSYPHGDTDDVVDSIVLALKYGGKGYHLTAAALR